MTPRPARGQPARTPNRRGEGAQLRNELIAAAGSLLDETGSEDALSMRAVARVAGVAPQSVYLHFADKASLLWEVYANRWAEIEAVMARAGAVQDPTARLRAQCRAYCDYALAHPGRFRSLVAAVGHEPPSWERRPPGTRAFDALHASVRSVMRAAPEDETFRATVCVVGALNGLLQLQLNRPRFPWPPVHELADEILSKLVAQVA